MHLEIKTFKERRGYVKFYTKKEIGLLVTELNKLKTNKISLGDELRLPECLCMRLSTHCQKRMNSSENFVR